MKYAIISDIHANATALRLVLDSIRQDGMGRIVCLGDIVGFHTSPGECIDLVRSNSILCIAGNHDDGVSGRLSRRFFPPECWEAIEWTRTQLTRDQIRFLHHLPKQGLLDDCAWIMHGTFGSSHRYLVGRMNLLYAALRLRIAGFRIAFHGHTHRPSCYRLFGKVAPWSLNSLDTSRPVPLSGNAHYIINPGSVGQPRLRDARATFTIFDPSTNQVEWRRIHYDYSSVVAKTLTIFPSHARLYRQFERPLTTDQAWVNSAPQSGPASTSWG